MKILAIETSANACSVALLKEEEIFLLHKILPMQQALNILPFIEQLLHEQKTQLKQLDAVAFGCGPGSFTGIRIATSVAQGLGYALDIPLISISSMAALAQTAFFEFGWKHLLVCVDAHIQEVYYAAYVVPDNEDTVNLQGQEIICKPEVIPIVENEHGYGVGNGWEVYANLIPKCSIIKQISLSPTAYAVAYLAKKKYLSKNWMNPAQAVPMYLRNSVAKKSK